VINCKTGRRAAPQAVHDRTLPFHTKAVAFVMVFNF
jgi:hypothetical protein